MALDVYFLLELAFAIAFSFVFLLVGLNAEKWWHGIIFFVLSMLASYESAMLLIASGSTYATAFYLFFVFIGIMDFILIILQTIQVWNVRYPSRDKPYRPER